jgi:hypothetical protein
VSGAYFVLLALEVDNKSLESGKERVEIKRGRREGNFRIFGGRRRKELKGSSITIRFCDKQSRWSWKRKMQDRGGEEGREIWSEKRGETRVFWVEQIIYIFLFYNLTFIWYKWQITN